MATNTPFYNIQGVPIYPSLSDIPTGQPNGMMSVAADTGVLYMSFNGVPTDVASITGEGANATLSNLTSPTSVNQDLIPATDNSKSLGSAAKAWMSAILRALKLNGSTSGTVTVQAADTTTDYAVKMPAAQGAASSVLANDGSGNLSWSVPSVDANRTLSNLTSPTAVNQNLNPNASMTLDIGNFPNFWNNIYLNTLRFIASDLSGGISLRPSTATSTTSYMLELPPAQGAASSVLTNDGAGALSWTVPSASGANTALSNLASTAVNVSIIPGADGTIDLGSASNRWQYVKTQLIASGAGQPTIDMTSGIMHAADTSQSLNFSLRQLQDSAGAVQASWTTAGLNIVNAVLPTVDNAGVVGSNAQAGPAFASMTSYKLYAAAAGAAGGPFLWVDTSLGIMYDMAGDVGTAKKELDIVNRQLFDPTETISMNFGTRALYDVGSGIAATWGTTTNGIHLSAGGTAADTAALKFTVGGLLATPETGAMEFDGTNLYITIAGVRKTIVVA